MEQTTDFSDEREVDGVKLSHKLVSTSSAQNFTVVISKVEHNAAIDQTLVREAGELIWVGTGDQGSGIKDAVLDPRSRSPVPISLDPELSIPDPRSLIPDP